MSRTSAAIKPPVLPIVGRGLSFVHDGRAIVDRLDIEISPGPRTLAILGPNGAGKSVLLRMLAGLLPPTSGTVTWAGSAPDAARALKIGFVFQRPVLLRRSAIENVVYVLRAAGHPISELNDRALAALKESGLEQLATMPARQMSGGEQQRLALARALAQQPELLILDEPAANLDPASVAAIEARLRLAEAAGMSIVIVSHDLAQVRRIAGEVAFMHRGQILERAPVAAFFNKPKSKKAQAFIRGELLV